MSGIGSGEGQFSLAEWTMITFIEAGGVSLLSKWSQ
jgi:hypothetical protein